MGVPGLWKELQSHGCDTALARLSELKDVSPTASSSPSSSPSSSSKALRLGIDVSSWLFHAQKSIGGHNPQLRLLFYRLCRLLTVPDVLPVFVFDGPLRPKEKRGKVTQRYREVAFISDFKDLIVAFGFIVHDALGEAEAEMARLVQGAVLDAVMSDDVDCFVFGAALVVRNWGQELSGSKARTGYVAEQSASEAPSASSADEQAGGVDDEQRPMSAKDRLALGTNLITYFKATSLEADGITQAGLVLVAVLSGGDYDVQGLPRCGAKISIALARAGYGDSLVKGLKRHCRPPVQPSRSSRLAAPEVTESWSGFLAEWRDAVRHELSTNQSGYIGKRFKKLAASPAFAELLSTKASLSVLGSYVWPVTNTSSLVFKSAAVDIGKIGQLCQDLFHWTAPHTLETFRNNLWEGCAVREMCGGSVVNLKRTATRAKKANADGGTISAFFTGRAREAEHISTSSSESADTAPLVISVTSERESGSTGYVREARVVCDVNAYVDLAKGGLDFSLSFHDFEDGEGPSSSQSTTASPRKRKPLTDPRKELRMWIAQDVMKRVLPAAKELEIYHRKKNAKGKENSSKNTFKQAQGRLDTFFVGGKAGLMPSHPKEATKVSPSKRRAPLQSSQSSLSSAPSRSRSPSPTFLFPSKSSSRMRVMSPSKENFKQLATIPGWTSDLLDDSSDEEATHDDDDFDFNDDSTLPAIILPSKGKQDTPHSFPADESVEFISASMIPLQSKRYNNTSSMAIEVSDDSDEG